MKTVGLITIHRVFNCGSFLQTYATMKTVENLGYKCTLIDYLYPTYYHIKKAIGNENTQTERHRFIKAFLKMLGLLDVIKSFCAWRRLEDAAREFRRFSQATMTRPYSRRQILAHPPAFDIYLTGSDQTWNPRYMADDYSYLLDFTPDSSRRVAYAASFGCNKLPDRYEADYSRLLKRYEAISVRETSGVPIVASLANKEARDVVDPTFLLSAADWREKEASQYAPSGRFIFAYILSYVFDPYPYVVSLLEHLARVLDAKVVVYADGIKASQMRGHGFIVYDDNTHRLKPDEFLEYVDKSVFVVTSSFHGAAFAVNFRKDFYAILNPNTTKDDRVKSFLAKVGLESRGVKMGTVIDLLVAPLTDYSGAEARIEGIRVKSSEFLKQALGES